MTCKAIRQGDQMQCASCGLAWDVGDVDRPACRPVAGSEFNLSARRRRTEWKFKSLRNLHGLRSRNHD